MFLNCADCDLVYASPFELQQHRQSVHETAEAGGTDHRRYCKDCDYEFDGERAFVSHMQAHAEGRPMHICKRCNTPFTTTAILQAHRAATNGECAALMKKKRKYVLIDLVRELCGSVSARVLCCYCCRSAGGTVMPNPKAPLKRARPVAPIATISASVLFGCLVMLYCA